MSNNTSQSLLDSLLFIAEQNWGIDKKEIQEAMNKIAFHESTGGNPTALQDLKPGIGKGRGLFQFEIGKDEGANTALNRLYDQIELMKKTMPNINIPDFAKEWRDLEKQGIEAWDTSGYDAATLSPIDQQILFLGNILRMPDRKEKGYGPARFHDIDKDKKISDEELAQYWAQYHQAGTKPGTKEYESMLDKFTQDVQFYKP